MDAALDLRPFGLVLLVIAFIGIVAWVYWPKNKKKYEEAAHIPLQDDTEVK